MFVASLIERAATRWPSRTAVVDGDRSLRYDELLVRVARLANALRGLGLEAGDRVIDIQTNAHTYLESDLACAVAGIVRVPVNVRLTLEEWSYIAADAGARGIVYGERFVDRVTELLDAAEFDVCIRVGERGPGLDYELVLGDASPRLSKRRSTPGELVSLNYSSGTTGRPKGCMRTAANRHVSMQDMLTSLFECTLSQDDIFLHAGPMTHASGLFVLPHVAVGATQLLLDHFDAETVARLLHAQPISATVLVPTMLERLLAVLPEDQQPDEFPSLRYLAYAGAPMAQDRILAAHRRLPGVLTQFYGLVEAIPPVTVLPTREHDVEHLRPSVGRAAVGVALQIVDGEDRVCAHGEIGELVVGGLHVMAGYWGDDEATVKSVKDGWLYTGDLASSDDDGYVFLVDRKGDMIITGGYNVMPREVENVLAEVTGVAEVAVVGLPDPDWGEAVTAFVVPTARAELDASVLIAHCADRLSSFKKPKRVEFVGELPKSSTGKISRSALRRAHAESSRELP
jgi:acyl-CoA synthetase (AMP-forming)/AMP-acid ligase II